MGNASHISKKTIINDISLLDISHITEIKTLIKNEIYNKFNVANIDEKGNKIIKFSGYYVDPSNRYNDDLKYMYFDIPNIKSGEINVLLSHSLLELVRNILEEENFIYTIIKQQIEDNNSNYANGYFTIKLKK